MLQVLVPLSVGLLTWVAPALAQPALPYNPTRLVPAQNGSVVYIFSPQSSPTSQFSLSWLNTSQTVNSSSPKTTPFSSLPFLTEADPRAFITLPPDDEGFSVLVGDCNDSAQDLELWRFIFDADFRSGVWRSPTLDTQDDSLSLKYLSAGFTFSPTNMLDNVALYVFGGMCPNTTSSDDASWITDAAYSNTMLNIAQGYITNDSKPYTVSLTGERAPPVAEAGLTITPLSPTSSNTSSNAVSTQQNFVLLGGHTQNAFINMSQLAIFSLPQGSWAFVDANQADQAVEPRSGHTAVLTEDGSKIVVFGGWVGDINTPAQPQLVVLDIAQEYGGQGSWAWTTPTSTSSPLPADQGIYGHGAVMLPGGVMMLTGGYLITKSGSKSKRDISNSVSFLNTTSFEWSDTYSNPHMAANSPAAAGAEVSSSGLKTSEKAGLGAGIGLGLLAVALVVVVWLFYSRRLRTKRALREKELRALALGAERYHTPLPPGEDGRYPGVRSASWGAVEEQKLESSGNPFPWAPIVTVNDNGHQRLATTNDKNDSARNAERTGVQMEIPSPTRGLRKSLVARGPNTYHPYPLNQHPPNGPGAVFRIEEEDEGSNGGSLKRAKTPRATVDTRSVGSDPFKDPILTADDPTQDEAAIQRKREVEGWVDDWQSAAESMTVSRSTSQAHSRTYSNLSQFRQPVVGETTGRGSPEKSDRTGSNLSEKSVVSNSSFQRSVAGTISRNVSQRSASAGYALFSGAAAAMGRIGYGRQGNVGRDVGAGLTRAPSNRSVSLNIDTTRNPDSSDGVETFSSATSKWAPTPAGEDQALLNRSNQPWQNDDRDYFTLPESPSKEKYSRAGSLTSSSRRALNLLGSMRRVFSGTGGVSVQDRVAAFEGGSTQSSPAKRHAEMSETAPSRTLSGGTSTFWRGKQGAKDWVDDLPGSSSVGPSSTVRRKPVPGVKLNDDSGALEHDEDWDVETAVQQRVVQVMFTVPKEKLRVVNADALSLLSSNRSEVDQDEDKERDQVKRMSSVREGDEDYNDYQMDDETIKGKGKDRSL